MNVLDRYENESDKGIYEYNLELLKILLQDKTTGKNIKWACKDYEDLGDGFYESDEIQPYLITGRYGNLIQPRVVKSKEKKRNRTRNNGEVFTPSWICNEQNNIVDNQWLNNKNVFNVSMNKSWITNTDKIHFPLGKTWKDYVISKRLEISCGEAPYLVSRYDTVTGNMIDVSERIGLLDRKLRIINENIDDEVEWYKWVIRAYESIYAYDYQGDNVFLARENLLFTFIDNNNYKFGREPKLKQLKNICNIITWNVWQMDGITMTTPFSEEKPKQKQMNFDVIVGNPPYMQIDGGGTGDSSQPIYQYFVEQSKALNPNFISMIIPSRWMKGGKGLDKFRNNMMDDTRIRYIYDYEDARECFPSIHLDSGVCYFLWDREYDAEANFVFKSRDGEEINSIRFLRNDISSTIIRDYRQVSIIEKVSKFNEIKFNTIVSSRNPYGFATDFFNRPQNYSECDIKDEPFENYNKIFGVKGKKGGAKRIVGYVNPKSIIKGQENIEKYKLFFSYAYSTNATIPPKIIIAEPREICTETFLQIGSFNSKEECINCYEYMQGKFFRALLFFNRIQKNASKKTFELIPMQDFSKKWSDLELYRKYQLTKDEIDFIEKTIKPIEEKNI